MAVEIYILSGVRQGERVVLDATNFRVGTNPGCEVFFDPQVDTSTANRSAAFRLMEDGWYIVHAEGAILINQRAVAGPTRIRSGDVVRMSERGPDFSISIVTSTVSERIKSHTQSTNPPTVSGPLREFPPDTGPPVDSPATMDQITSIPPSYALPVPACQEVLTASSGVTSVPGTPIAVSTSSASTVVLTSIEQNTFSARMAGIKERWILWVAGGLVICVILALLMRGPASTTVIVKLDNPQAIKEDGIIDVKENKKTTQPVNQTPSLPAATTSTPAGTHTPTSSPTTTSLRPYVPMREEQIAAQIKDGVFLIQVEKAGRFWPLDTCCAIGKNTLLTRAWVACKISEWRKDPQTRFGIWVTNPKSNVKMAVQDIYINALLTTLENKPDDWKYYDVALLTVAEELPKIMPLASKDEIDNLKEGLPIYCVGFSHEGEKITEFDSFQSQVMPGKIYLIAAPPNLPSHPRLLQIKGKILKNTFGSPIVNDQGKIVAIYCDAMQPQSEAEKYLPEIHYATVLNPELINLGLNREYGKIWISPDLYGIVSKAKDKK